MSEQGATGGNRRAPRILYGVYTPHESFCLLEEDEARGRLAETERIKSATTLGQLRAIATALRFVWLPADLDDLADEPDDMSWNWREDGLGVADGDWPPLPTSFALEL